MHPRVKALLWSLTAWLNIGTGLATFIMAHHPPELTITKLMHIIWLLLGVGHWLKGMTAFSYLITGKSIGELNMFFLRVDDKPLLKCGLGLIAFTILMFYCVTSVIGGLPFYWWMSGRM
jgi:hypothetical protein